MAKNILEALTKQRAREAAEVELMARMDEWSHKHVFHTGYMRSYTEVEFADIERLRAEMRERLTCPDDQYEEICRHHSGPDWKPGLASCGSLIRFNREN